jgi:hypothetical protein
MGLGGYARWSDKHLTVELNGKKESFYATKDRSARLQPEDAKKVSVFLASAGITPDMANG